MVNETLYRGPEVHSRYSKEKDMGEKGKKKMSIGLECHGESGRNAATTSLPNINARCPATTGMKG